MLPDAVDKLSYAPKVSLFYISIQAKVIPSIIIDTDMTDKGIHLTGTTVHFLHGSRNEGSYQGWLSSPRTSTRPDLIGRQSPDHR